MLPEPTSKLVVKDGAVRFEVLSASEVEARLRAAFPA